jgi:hypothetical protein
LSHLEGPTFRAQIGLHFSMLAGPHPRSLSRGDFAPRSGGRRYRQGTSFSIHWMRIRSL